MSGFSPELFVSTLALIGAVIVIASLLSGLVERSGLPQVAVFLALGAVIGPYGLGIADVTVDSPILRVVATLSLALVLFTDAVSLNVSELRSHKLLAFLVLGPGTIASALLAAGAGVWLLKLPIALALILGAALASTDPVLLRGIIRRPELSGTVRQALRIEAGLNDAVLLPIVLVAMAAVSHTAGPSAANWPRLALHMVVLSPAAGIIVALAGIGALEMVRRQLGVRRDYESIYSLGIAFAAFAAAESVHGSGFIAAFAAGLTVAALDVELCDCFLEYGETTAEMALLFTFVLFGVSLIWKGLATATPLALLFTLLVFVIRPLVFVPALAAAHMTWRDRALIGWLGPRGLSSLLLVLLPVFAGIESSGFLLSVACLVVLCSVVLHGLSPLALFHGAKLPRPAAPITTESSRTLKVLQPTQAESSEAADRTSASPEYIETAELRALMDADPKSVVLGDARSHRTYDESDYVLAEAVRIDPERAVAEARRLRLPQNTEVALFCA
jgi:NhaP-type Na+/H+ or K+/H+ antiporter